MPVQPETQYARSGEVHIAYQLVGEGKILKAQARLGHRDPVTTLRHYAHATPLDDLDVADQLDDLLNGSIG